MIAEVLLTNAIVTIGCFVLLWLICLPLKDVTPVDGFWGYGMVVLAGVTYVTASGGDPGRKMLLLALTALWGVRLGTHMVWRWRSHGPDRRYRSIMGRAEVKRGWGFAHASARMVFAVQAPLLMIVCLPAQLGQIGATPPLGILAWIGGALAVFGVVFEATGDIQLARFKADPANAGRVMQSGLWRYTRHPNYFGDVCAWWGIYIVAAETWIGLWSVPGPILITFMLTRWSGAPIVERKMSKTKPEYAEYLRRTSGFFPLPPARS